MTSDTKTLETTVGTGTLVSDAQGPVLAEGRDWMLYSYPALAT